MFNKGIEFSINSTISTGFKKSCPVISQHCLKTWTTFSCLTCSKTFTSTKRLPLSRVSLPSNVPTLLSAHLASVKYPPKRSLGPFQCHNFSRLKWNQNLSIFKSSKKSSKNPSHFEFLSRPPNGFVKPTESLELTAACRRKRRSSAILKVYAPFLPRWWGWKCMKVLFEESQVVYHLDTPKYDKTMGYLGYCNFLEKICLQVFVP